MSLNRDYYQGIERTLLAISNGLSNSVSLARRTQIQELIEEGEYSHALEGMVGLYLDEAEPAPYFVAAQILDLAATTGMSGSSVVADFERRALRMGPDQEY